MENTDMHQYLKQELNTVIPVCEQSLYYAAIAAGINFLIHFIGWEISVSNIAGLSLNNWGSVPAGCKDFSFGRCFQADFVVQPSSYAIFTSHLSLVWSIRIKFTPNLSVVSR
jgi:hypothetical protein